MIVCARKWVHFHNNVISRKLYHYVVVAISYLFFIQRPHTNNLSGIATSSQIVYNVTEMGPGLDAIKLSNRDEFSESTESIQLYDKSKTPNNDWETKSLSEKWFLWYFFFVVSIMDFAALYMRIIWIFELRRSDCICDDCTISRLQLIRSARLYVKLIFDKYFVNKIHFKMSDWEWARTFVRMDWCLILFFVKPCQILVSVLPNNKGPTYAKFLFCTEITLLIKNYLQRLQWMMCVSVHRTGPYKHL